jgi:SAM-dependent methyltransferase
VAVKTFKYLWVIDLESGNAKSIRRNSFFIKMFDPQPLRGSNPFSIYDYFIHPDHIQHSIKEGEKLITNVFNKYNITIEGKRILDISGGNGQVALQLKDNGASVVLTEVNECAIKYAKQELNIDAFFYDFQKNDIIKTVTGKFDIVMLRAAIMFCEDIDNFFNKINSILKPNGLMILQYCVVPTLGTFLRTQFDDYNYRILYQPDYIIDVGKTNGFDLIKCEEEIDPDMYVFDLDRKYYLTFFRVLYECMALKKIPFQSLFPLRARYRKRYLIIMRKIE